MATKGRKTAPKFMTRAEFAKHRHVSRPAVTRWVALGYAVTTEDGLLIDVQQSDELLNSRPETYRGGITSRPVY